MWKSEYVLAPVCAFQLKFYTKIWPSSFQCIRETSLWSAAHHPLTMGAKFSKPTSNPLRNVFSCFKCGQSRQPSFYHNISPQPSIFATLKRRNVPRPNEFIHLFSNCISAATARTQEYLTFKDPEDKLRPSPEVLTQVATLIEQNTSSITKTFCFREVTEISHALTGLPDDLHHSECWGQPAGYP